MTRFLVETEFDVTRRIGWEGTEDLAAHIDSVFELLRQNSDVRSIESTANLDSGRVSMDLELDTWEMDRNSFARSVVAVAIRSAGGQYLDLLPKSESAGSNVDSHRWSALRGPTWRCRRFAGTSDEP